MAADPQLLGLVAKASALHPPSPRYIDSRPLVAIDAFLSRSSGIPHGFVCRSKSHGVHRKFEFVRSPVLLHCHSEAIRLLPRNSVRVAYAEQHPVQRFDAAGIHGVGRRLPPSRVFRHKCTVIGSPRRPTEVNSVRLRYFENRFHTGDASLTDPADAANIYQKGPRV